MTRIWHPWWDWECFKAGFYSQSPPIGMNKESCEMAYRDFLADQNKFESYLDQITSTWIKSCEHFLSNEKINRVAWLGQASMCCATGVPSKYRGGFRLLSESQQCKANETAEKALNKWLLKQNKELNFT